MKKIKPIKGWVEIDETGKIVVGTFGVKVYIFYQDIIDEGFTAKEVSLAEITLVKKRKLKIHERN